MLKSKTGKNKCYLTQYIQNIIISTCNQLFLNYCDICYILFPCLGKLVCTSYFSVPLISGLLHLASNSHIGWYSFTVTVTSIS